MKFHPRITDSCNNVALIYHHLHEYVKASKLLQHSSETYENDYDQRIRVPICLHNVGLLHLDQHNYDPVIEYYFQALDLFNNENDKNIYQEEIGFTIDNLGVAYEMKSDFRNTLNFYNQILKIQLASFRKIY